MTTTRRHIEDLDVNEWAKLTRSAAVESVETSRRLGLQPRPETVALAAMTPGELAERRERHGPAKKRPSAVLQLVEADQRSREADSRARDAHQGRLDAEAAAAIARADADESARAATAARERVRALETETVEKDRRRAHERLADQQAVQQAAAETARVRTEAAAEIEQIRADAAAEVAAAQERVRAAEGRAEQRARERTAERSTGETAVQQLQVQLDKVRADAAAEVAAAQERVRAAETRAEQRVTERAAERAAGEEAVARLRGESEQVRADATAEVAAARGEVAAVRQATQTEIADVRRAAHAEIESARTYADQVARQAQAEVARVVSATQASRFLTIPIAPVEVRGQTRPIEDVLDALYQIDHVLEIGMTEAMSQPPPDIGFMRNLTWTVQQRVKDLPDELANLRARFIDPSHAETAASYTNAAGGAYQEFLQRIEAALHRLGDRRSSPDAEITEAVSAMLADPWVQALTQPPASAP
jgi:hypothetical protein